MNDIKLIWAETANGFIGRNGDLAWRDYDDLARFKELTLGSAIVMGRKTAESLKKPLGGRINIVLTRDKGVDLHKDYVILSNVQEVLDNYSSFWAIGGKAILEAFMPYASAIHQTVFTDITIDGDVNAPEIPPGWDLYNSMKINSNLTFNHYVREK